MEPCLVVVARDQPELFARLTAVYAGEEWIEVRLDRRTGQPWAGTGERPNRRASPRLDTDLADHGFVVIARD